MLLLFITIAAIVFIGIWDYFYFSGEPLLSIVRVLLTLCIAYFVHIFSKRREINTNLASELRQDIQKIIEGLLLDNFQYDSSEPGSDSNKVILGNLRLARNKLDLFSEFFEKDKESLHSSFQDLREAFSERDGEKFSAYNHFYTKMFNCLKTV